MPETTPPFQPSFATRKEFDAFLTFVFTKVRVEGNKVKFLEGAKEFLHEYFQGGFDVDAIQTVDDLEHAVKAWRELNDDELTNTLELNFWKSNSAADKANIVSILGYVPAPVNFGE